MGSSNEARMHDDVEALWQKPEPIDVALERTLLPSPVGTAVHASGLVALRFGEAAAGASASGVVVRIELVRAIGGATSATTLYRKSRERTSHDVFGGTASPLVSLSATPATNTPAEVVLGPRPGYKLNAVDLRDGVAFFREDFLAAFDGSLNYDNGRLDADAHDDVEIVQLSGQGTVVLELFERFAAVRSTAEKPILARREWLVGWRGRLIPRLLDPAEAPGGQHGLVQFSGAGTVLLLAR